jgi:hypothetical protein
VYEQVLAWAVLVVLLILCLPFTGLSRLVLEITVWGLRLAMIALLAGAGYLWFYPDQMPPAVMSVLSGWPNLLAFLPERGSPYFGVGLIAPVVAALLPVLAILDLIRLLAGRPLRQLRAIASGKAVVPAAAPPAPAPAPAPARAMDRQTAAAAMAAAARRPDRPGR